MTAVDATGSSFQTLTVWHELRTHTMPRQRKQRAARAVLWLLIVAVLGGNLYILSQRNKTTVVTFDDALRNFRTSQGTGASLDVLAPASPDATPDGGAGAHVSIPQDDAGLGRPVAPIPHGSPVQAPPSLRPFYRPPEGVYSYRTSGGESVSVAGSSHKYPERTFATVRYLDGCNWEIRNDVVEEHVDRRVFCSQYELLTQLQQERWIEFFGQRDGMVVVCDPPALFARTGEAVSAVTSSVCKDDQVSVRLRRTVAAYEDLRVGGQAVPAVHISIDATFTGRADGSAHEDLWLAKNTGMTLKWHRTVDTIADAAFGAKVRYQEDVTFLLESLVPQT